MAKEFLHKEGLTKLVENIKAWCKGAFLGKDATITKSSGTNKGVSVSIQGSVSEPSVSVSVTTGGVSENNSGIVSGVEVKTYVDENAAKKDTFKAATSSSNAVNGLVPAPSSANATKFLRGDGTWTTPPLATNDIDGLMSATDKTTLDQSVAMVTPMTGDDGSCVLEVERNDGTYLEFPVPKVGSAKEADNAAKVEGKDIEALWNYMFNGDTPRYIPIGTDLDTLYGEDKCGFWNSYDNTEYTNCPIMNFGLLVVRINTSYFAQLLLPFDTGSVSDVIRYRSQSYDSQTIRWNGWMKTVKSEDLTQLISRIESGEIVAGNALKLEGTPLRNIHEDVSFNYMLIGDTEGWYRIAHSLDFANSPRSFMLFLERQYGYDSPESYVFSISNTMGDYFSITQLSGVASTRLIDKIRVVNSAKVSDYIYIDIHVNPVSGYQNRIYWGVVGNAVAYNREKVVFNPELPGVHIEFETVNGFKTNQNIYEGSSALSEKYIGKLASTVFHGNRGVLTTENVAALHCGLYNSYESIGGTNVLPINYASVVQFGNLYYTPQMCLNNTGERLWFRSVTRTADREGVSDWNEVAFKTLRVSASASNKGISVALGGTVGEPTLSVTTTTGGVSAANSGVVSGKEVKDYVDANAATKSVFSAATSSSVGSNGLVPAPSSANATKFLRGDGTWQTPTITKDSVTSALGYTPAKEVPNTMVWGGILNTVAYATDYAVGTVLKVTTSESLSILKDNSLINSSLASGTNVIVSHESYMSGSSYNSGKVFVIF